MDNGKIRERGQEIFRLMEDESPTVFSRKGWNAMLMNLAMSSPKLKVQLFHFVDVLPTLTTPEQLVSHIREYFLDESLPISPLLKRIVAGVESRATAGITAALVRRNIISFSRNFIAGETAQEALPVLQKNWQEGSGLTVDVLGEAALSEREAEEYQKRYLDMVAALANEMQSWPAGDAAHEQLFPRLNVSVKISSLFSRIGPVNYDESVAIVKERLRPIFRAVREAGGLVILDMETCSLKNLTLDIFCELLEEEEFRDWSHAGIAMQAYLKETWDDLQRLIEWSQSRKRRITVRLVKGAYWEYEIVNARQKNWPVPVFENKAHTDWNYERCAELLLANTDTITPALATHNVRSLAAAMIAAQRHDVKPDAFEFQMLFGMAEPVKHAVRRMGYAVREYTPVGALIPGMAYLVRRLLENTSNEGFLRKAFADNAERDLLLAAPEPWPGEAPVAEHEEIGPFCNEPLLDFSHKGCRDECRAAIEKVRAELGKSYPALIGGRETSSVVKIVSVNPAMSEQVVGEVASLSREDVAEALSAARAAQPAWEKLGAHERAGFLFRAAEITRRRRKELIAWQLFETGKNWAEADADVCEAIDFFEYYGREMLRLGEPFKVGNAPGEDNRYFYRARGVALVIAPWNFPCAISAGMASAALVSGNTVLYKPASASPVIGWKFVDIMREAGLPDGVLNFIPGRGEIVGGFLVEHADLDLIAFTGSREVGLELIERAGRPAADARSVKRVIAEMGGKNAVIVDDDADLDQAVAGVMQSAFGYQGQKCSACSRVIVLAGCYERFLERLVEAVKDIRVGPAEDPANFMGPLIDRASRERVERYIALAREQGRIAVQGEAPQGECYVAPTVVADLPADSAILHEEIFGPLLAVVKAKDIDEALAIANDSDYALTGGFYSRSPANIRKVVREFAAGNLYINRGITGAIVGRQPFGGFRMSGVGSKAGGPDYLLQFMEPRVVTENTLRRGFSPDVMS